MKRKLFALFVGFALLTGCSQLEDVEWIDGKEYDELELEELIEGELEHLNKHLDLEVNIYSEDD